MDKYTLEALNRLVNYVYDDEIKDFKAQGEPKEHIFNDIKLVADFVDKNLT